MRELRGDPLELFRHLPDGSISQRMRFAVETLLEPHIRDEFDQKIELTCTRVRYEITIVRREENGVERFFVEEEHAKSIKKQEDHWKPYGKNPSKEFYKSFIRPDRPRKTDFINTIGKEHEKIFQLGQDGKQGIPRHLPAVKAERSVLSSVTLVKEFPHLYALRKEFESLRYLQLDPAAQRQPSDFDAAETLDRDGANLTTVLYRILREISESASPKGALADILADLSTIIPGIVDLDVERDDARKLYNLRLKMRDGQAFTSRVVSDGTLRVLALLTLLYDPRHRGVLCFEEPENGIHKTIIEALMHFLQEACTDPSTKELDVSAPLTQIIINTHSTIAARSVRKSLILAEMNDVNDPGSVHVRRRTKMEPYTLVEQADWELDGKAHRATIMKIENLLKESEQSTFAA